MNLWSRIKCSLEWGLFYGIVTWLLTTTITNDIPAIGIWAMIISRMGTGVLLVLIPLSARKWISGAVWGAGVNCAFGLLALLPAGGGYDSFFFGWQRGFLLVLISGIIMGGLIEHAVRHREKYLKKVHEQEAAG